jgi:hypothetical protein
VAVTPDELDDAWREAKVHLPLRSIWNERLIGQPDAGMDIRPASAVLSVVPSYGPARTRTRAPAFPFTNYVAYSGKASAIQH